MPARPSLVATLCSVLLAALLASGCARPGVSESVDTPSELVGLIGTWTSSSVPGVSPARLVGPDPSPATVTPCGPLSATGYPVYCPNDATIYWPARSPVPPDGLVADLILAHENGHHIMFSTGSAPNDPWVAERRADCMAGVWVDYARTIGLPGLDGNLEDEVAAVFASTTPGGPYRSPRGRSADVVAGMSGGMRACALVRTRA